MTPLSKLIQHCTWANGSWIRLVADVCPDDVYLRQRMSHILLSERAWFQRMAGEEPSRDLWTALTVARLREVHAEHRATYDELISGNLDRVIAYTRFTGETYQSTVADLLTHLVLHGAHHRGQMATYASAHGVKPINTDYVQFCLTHGL